MKLRGYRIELGDIEAALRSHPGVADAVATVRSDGAGARRLVGYVTQDPEYGSTTTAAEALALAQDQIADWRTIHDSTYAEAQAHAGSDFHGWNNSYTGLPIDESEMRSWLDETIDRVRALRPRRILEIGCGSGLVLLRLAAQSTEYVGTDFSAAVLGRLQARLTSAACSHVRVLHRHAEDFSGIDGPFDLVILNSVVQYFPSIDYLVHVLSGVARLLAPGGHVFVGDVRTCRCLRLFTPQLSCTQRQARLRVKPWRGACAIVLGRSVSCCWIRPASPRSRAICRGSRVRKCCRRADVIAMSSRPFASMRYSERTGRGAR